VGGASLGALSVGQFIPPAVAQAARQLGSLDADGDGYIPTLCEMCVWRCGVLARVEEGRVVKLEGNPEHPHSKGKLCARGQSGLMNTYDPDRVLFPLVRVGKRGEGKFRRASWEEALDTIAGNMLKIKEKYGAEAMLFSSTHNLSQVQPVFQRHGNRFSADLRRGGTFAKLSGRGIHPPGGPEPDGSHLDLGDRRAGRGGGARR
jgi:thiosulfate reductase/polysulfide reductase chain A